MERLSSEQDPNQKELTPEVQSIANEEYVNKDLQEIKEYDRATYEHSIEVANLISLIWKKIGLTQEEAQLLMEAALVHDLGKIKIDPNILFKKGQLNNEDWQEIKKHPHNSFQLIKDSGGKLEVAKIAVAHHDYGGSLSASRVSDSRRHDDLPVGDDARKNERRTIDIQQLKLSKILAIVDNFEALHSQRQYKESFSLEKCRAELLSKFPEEEDKKVIEALMETAAD